MPKSKDELKILKQNLYNEIDNAIVEGYETFLFGACYGFDLLCAEMVKSLLSCGGNYGKKSKDRIIFKERR